MRSLRIASFCAFFSVTKASLLLFDIFIGLFFALKTNEQKMLIQMMFRSLKFTCFGDAVHSSSSLFLLSLLQSGDKTLYLSIPVSGITHWRDPLQGWFVGRKQKPETSKFLCSGAETEQ